MEDIKFERAKKVLEGIKMLLEKCIINSEAGQWHTLREIDKQVTTYLGSLSKKSGTEIQLSQLDASDAKKIADTEMNEDVKKELDTCLKRIMEAAKNNSHDVTVPGSFKKMTLKLLTDRGFTYEKGNGDRPFDPSYIRIYW